jgi:hypothetical protein
MIGEQYKDFELKQALKNIQLLEKLIELNMKDLWDIADQRDWYYSEYQRLKNCAHSSTEEQQPSKL